MEKIQQYTLSLLRKNLTNRLMILNGGMTMMEYTMILNYWSNEQYVIFWHWQLKSIPNAIKNICFLPLSIPWPCLLSQR